MTTRVFTSPLFLGFDHLEQNIGTGIENPVRRLSAV